MAVGREMRVPIDLWVGRPEDNANFVGKTDYAQNLEEKLDRVHLFAHENLQQSSLIKKRRYDATAVTTRYSVGSGSRKKGKSPKLSPRWQGPYVVVNHLNDMIVRIQRSPWGETEDSSC